MKAACCAVQPGPVPYVSYEVLGKRAGEGEFVILERGGET